MTVLFLIPKAKQSFVIRPLNSTKTHYFHHSRQFWRESFQKYSELIVAFDFLQKLTAPAQERPTETCFKKEIK